MNPTRRPVLVCCLVAALLVGAAAPCALVEAAADPACTTETAGPAEGASAAEGPAAEASPAGEAADAVHPDCCAGCLTCCASYTEASAPGALAESGPAAPYLASPEDGPRGTALSIWRPPRA